MNEKQLTPEQAIEEFRAGIKKRLSRFVGCPTRKEKRRHERMLRRYMKRAGVKKIRRDGDTLTGKKKIRFSPVPENINFEVTV